MSAATVPYQLRPNKHVDRELFIDALSRIREVGGYRYASMGGKFMEDIVATYLRLGINHLTSIDLDPNTVARQQFNRPLSNIDIRQLSSGEFVRELVDGRLDDVNVTDLWAIWLDYTDPANRLAQLTEVVDLLSVLEHGEVLKVTMNANPRTLAPRQRDYYPDDGAWRHECEEGARTSLADFFPQAMNDENPSQKRGFARVVGGAIHNAAVRARSVDRSKRFALLQANRYTDLEHQMVSIAVLVLRAPNDAQTVGYPLDLVLDPALWLDPVEIALPDLSARERFAIDRMLFQSSVADIRQGLGFELGERENETLSALRQYEQHFRQYPNFTRVAR